jgi:hypothetical protein
MPSRKQRRRREKLKRHEYEYVVETEEGEVPLERLRDLDESEQADRKRNGGGSGALVDRRGQPIQKPSLRRVLRRALIFTPFLFLFVYLIGGDELTLAQKIVQAAFLLVLFIPFSYLVDQFVYRMLVRRAERGRTTGRAR